MGANIAAAVQWITQDYGGHQTFDNGQKEGPLVAYSFPATPVQIGVRLNKQRLTLYVREHTPDGRCLVDVVPGLEFKERYDASTGSPAGSIKSGRVPYLRLGETSVLRLEPSPDQLRAVLDACLGRQRGAAGDAAPAPSTAGRSRRALTPEDLLTQLDRRSELGRQGEAVAVLHEIERLRGLGCVSPEHHVRHVALDDVGVGYDIASLWLDHERCIEVKTSTQADADFYVSANEREVLAAKGKQAWIYRVLVRPAESAVVMEIQDPMNPDAGAEFTPQVWRVRIRRAAPLGDIAAAG